MDKEDVKILKVFLLLAYPFVFFYVLGTLYPYRGPPTLDIARAVVPNVDAVPLVFVFTLAYPLPLFLYYSYERSTHGPGGTTGSTDPKLFFLSPLLLTIPAVVLCLLITVHSAPSYPSSVLNPLPLASAAETVMRGLMVPFTSIWYMLAIYYAIAPYNPNFWYLTYLGYVFVLFTFIFPVFQWFVAKLMIKKVVVPLRELKKEGDIRRPKHKLGYRDVVGVDKFRDPAVPVSEGAGTGINTGMGTGAGAGAGTRTVAPIPPSEHFLKYGTDEQWREEERRRIDRLNSTPVTDEYLKRAREALQELYGLVESEGIVLTQKEWVWFINFLEDGIIFTMRRGTSCTSPPTTEVQRLDELLARTEYEFQDRVILLLAYVTFAAALFEDFKQQGLTRADRIDDFIEERVLAARGYLRPTALLRPENYNRPSGGNPPERG